MRTSDVAAFALAVISVLSPGAAGAAELTVLAGMGVVSGVRDVALAFERATGHKVIDAELPALGWCSWDVPWHLVRSFC